MRAKLVLAKQEPDSKGQPEALAFSTKLDLATSVLEAVHLHCLLLLQLLLQMIRWLGQVMILKQLRGIGW